LNSFKNKENPANGGIFLCRVLSDVMGLAVKLRMLGLRHVEV
jgi:hypothetical protein